jgi:Adenylate and Guanylate cyclase catalytic domain
MATAHPTGTVTFLFSDIEGSTVRWERNHDAMASALARHDALMRVALKARGAYVFKTIGDAFCAAFAHPQQAIAAALDAQRALATEDFSAVVFALHGDRARAATLEGYAEKNGEAGGFASFMGMIPAKSLAVAILTNSRAASPTSAGIRFLRSVGG